MNKRFKIGDIVAVNRQEPYAYLKKSVYIVLGLDKDGDPIVRPDETISAFGDFSRCFKPATAKQKKEFKFEQQKLKFADRLEKKLI